MLQNGPKLSSTVPNCPERSHFGCTWRVPAVHPHCRSRNWTSTVGPKSAPSQNLGPVARVAQPDAPQGSQIVPKCLKRSHEMLQNVHNPITFLVHQCSANEGRKEKPTRTWQKKCNSETQHQTNAKQNKIHQNIQHNTKKIAQKNHSKQKQNDSNNGSSACKHT